MVICVPVADLRAQPHKAQITKGPALSRDIWGQISQLVYGEFIRAQRDHKNPGWLIVEALGHKHFCGVTWQNLRGYIQDFQAYRAPRDSSCNSSLVITGSWVPIYFDKKKLKAIQKIPFGSRLEGKKSGWQWYRVTLHDGREGFVERKFVYHVRKNLDQKWESIGPCLASRARQFVGCPYVWGGRSPYNPLLCHQITGYDCSALIHAIYQSYGLRIPRNSHNQFLNAKSLCIGNDLQPGDCLFFGRLGSDGPHMKHVMMYLGEGQVLDSPGLGYKSVQEVSDPALLSTRVLSVKQATGMALNKLIHGIVCPGGARKNDTVFLGTYRDMIQKLRSDFLT